MTYKKVFLSRIIIESDIDMLGVVFESIQVTCKFKTNAKNYSLSKRELLNLILEQTVDAERNEIFERPPERLNLYLLRNKLRSIQLYFDYSIQEETSSYGKSFNSDFKLTLYGLIRDFEDQKNKPKADVHISFDLTKRTALDLVEGSIYPTQTLPQNANKDSRFEEKVERVLRQIDPVLSLLDTAQIIQLTLKKENNFNFKCSFDIRKSKRFTLNYIDLTKVETFTKWSKIFKIISDNFATVKTDRSWVQTVKVDLMPLNDTLVPYLHDYYLSFNCNEKMSTQAVVSKIDRIENLLGNKYQINRVAYQTEGDNTRLIELHVESNNGFYEKENIPLAMKLKPIKLQGRITRYFDKSNKGYFLSAEKYQCMVK